MKIPGKVAFITGVASGYGKEFTLRLLRDGCKVRGGVLILIHVKLIDRAKKLRAA